MTKDPPMTKGIPEILGGMVDSLFLLAPRVIAACRPPRATAQYGFESTLDHLFEEGYVAHPERFFSFPAGVPAHRVVDESPYEDGAYELICFESDYAPRIPMLRETYLSHAANGTGYVARWTHRKPAPRTVLCLHGYLLGDPSQAHRMFRIRRLFDMGLDVALFITPFHWRRAPASVSQRGIFLSPHDPAMTCECVGHAMHDLAGALAILKELGSTGTGLIGASLGGYLAGLYVCLRDDVDFSAMMVPAVNLSRPLGTDTARFAFPVSAGLRERMRQVYEMHSPLRFSPRLSRDRILIIASRGDLLCPFEYTRLLCERWGWPEHVFLRGGHWLVFNPGLRGRAWYSFLGKTGYL